MTGLHVRRLTCSEEGWYPQRLTPAPSSHLRSHQESVPVWTPLLGPEYDTHGPLSSGPKTHNADTMDGGDSLKHSAPSVFLAILP